MANATEPSVDPARARPASELSLRVISALVLAAAALLTTVAGGWLFALFWLLAGAAILFEWIAMTRVEPRSRLQFVLIAVLAGLALAVFGWGSLPVIAVLGACGALAPILLARRRRDGFWAAAGFAYAAIIALVPPVIREHPRLGTVAILWMFAVVWATDVAAYFAGRHFGGPKLWPSVSPKKTWSGFFGGLAAGLAAGAAVVIVAEALGWASPVGLAVVILISVVASVLGQLGDLGESALKRRFGAKDSSHLIPGHGGVMDRLDAFWAVAAFLGLLLAGAQAARAEWASG